MLDDVDGLGLVEKAAGILAIGSELRVQHFDRRAIADDGVGGLVDRAHSAFAESSQQPKAAKQLAYQGITARRCVTWRGQRISDREALKTRLDLRAGQTRQ